MKICFSYIMEQNKKSEFMFRKETFSCKRK